MVFFVLFAKKDSFGFLEELNGQPKEQHWLRLAKLHSMMLRRINLFRQDILRIILQRISLQAYLLEPLQRFYLNRK